MKRKKESYFDTHTRVLCGNCSEWFDTPNQCLECSNWNVCLDCLRKESDLIALQLAARGITLPGCKK